MSRVEPNTYSFVTKDGYDHMAIMMEEGKYKGVAWGYTKISIPEVQPLIDRARLQFEFEILDNGGLAFEEIDEEEFLALMGDILADQIDEQIKEDRVQFS